MNIDELWWTYRCLQYLQEMTMWFRPQPAERASYDSWPPPSGPRPFWPNLPAYGLKP